jgi:hypothetical protein
MKGRGERWGACGVRGREEKEGKREQRHQGGSPLLYWCGGVGRERVEEGGMGAAPRIGGLGSGPAWWSGGGGGRRPY